MPGPIARRDFVRTAAAAGVALPLTRWLGDHAVPAGQLAIVDTTVFDARTRRLRPHETVVVTGDRVSAIGPAAGLKAPPGARTIDGRGRYLIPGLIDAHVHLTHVLFQAGVTGDDILPLFLAHGVTSVRSTGDNVPAQALLQRYAASHAGIAPRIFSASYLIDGAAIDHPDVGWSLTDPAQVPDFVAQMARWQVTTLKIYVGVERPVGRRIIEEAHQRGLVVAGHLERYAPADAATDGIDSLEHIYTIADFARATPDDRHSFDPASDATKRLVDHVVAHNVAIDPTLMVFWGTLFFVDVPAVIEHPDNGLVPKRLRDYWLADNPRRLKDFSAGPLAIRWRTFGRYQELVGLLHRSGVRILAGTDSAEPQVTPGAALHHELELLVESGMGAADVLASATLENATILGQDANLGAVEQGKLADLVLLDADPLADIRNTRRIRQVIRGGMALAPATIMESRVR
ncbi:MAG: amidohydrolase family protein [Gemmatimonadetes bacterium]|nr:amidohydrolase family protein [Gemmatimonadota bacterium]